MIKKADIILAAALIIIGLTLSFILTSDKSAGDELIIKADGKKFGSYSLLENKEIIIKKNSHINKVTINDGVVSMSFSDCTGQDCVNHHPISDSGETIICLPNKIVLEITGREDKYDIIAK